MKSDSTPTTAINQTSSVQMVRTPISVAFRGFSKLMEVKSLHLLTKKRNTRQSGHLRQAVLVGNRKSQQSLNMSLYSIMIGLGQ
jgi:hypothetical protein